MQSVLIYDGFPFASTHNAPVMRQFLMAHLDIKVDDLAPHDYGLRLAQAIKKIRPELDIFLLSDRNAEAIAADPAADCIRRVFYDVEEPLEIHLSILEGVQDRYETPFFDNLKKYAQKPDRHLPRAADRARQVDLQVQLDPRHGRVLRAQPVPRRIVGHHRRPRQPARAHRQHQGRRRRRRRAPSAATDVFWVTNGTSTSNKIVEQALLQPGDIVIVDRNCHKSHHYGCVLAGAQPYYVEAFPMTEYSMYGGVPLRDDQEGAAGPQGRGAPATR